MPRYLISDVHECVNEILSLAENTSNVAITGNVMYCPIMSLKVLTHSLATVNSSL